MRTWSRILLIVLLAIGLPLQGWAAVRMATGMAGQVLALHGSNAAATTVVGEAMAEMADHHHHACCDPLQDGTQADHTGGPCGDACHCCISAAPVTCMLMAQPEAPPHVWFAVAHGPCATVPSSTPDKPPKA
jgi:hypothetical protein